jgi:hypothetical protein
VYLTNAFIYENSANSEGGGYAACPISHTYIHATNGAALYSNKAASAKEIYILASTGYGAHSGDPIYTISESMLGGNPYHWKYDDNTEVPLNRLSGQLRAIYNESLSLHTDETPGENTKTQAHVQIFGNTSATRGGGIGSNGTVYIGKEDTTKVTAQKKWDDDNQSSKRPDSIQVQLFRSTKSDLSDKQYIGYITLTPDKDGNWTNTAEFKNLAEKDADGNAYIYTVGEKKIDGYDATVTQDEKTKDFTITNKPSQTPPTPPTPTPNPTYRHVTVQKVWKLDDGGTRPDSVQVQLMRNGTAYGQPVTLNEANNWSFTWNNLEDDNSTWTVQEVIIPNGFTASQETASETDGSKITITNDDQPTKPNNPEKPNNNNNKPNKPDNPKSGNKTHKPDNPKTPSTNSKTNKTVTPKSPVSPKTPSIQHTTVQNTASSPAAAPKTSDQTRLGTDLMLFGGAAALLAVLLAVKRRRS